MTTETAADSSASSQRSHSQGLSQQQWSSRKHCSLRLLWHSAQPREMFLHQRRTATCETEYRYRSYRNDKFPQLVLKASQGWGPKVGVLECTSRTWVESLTRRIANSSSQGGRAVKIQGRSHRAHRLREQERYLREFCRNPPEQFSHVIDIRSHAPEIMVGYR